MDNLCSTFVVKWLLLKQKKAVIYPKISLYTIIPFSKKKKSEKTIKTKPVKSKGMSILHQFTKKKDPLFDTVCLSISQADTACRNLFFLCLPPVFPHERSERAKREEETERGRERKEKRAHQSSSFLLPTMSSVSCVPSFTGLTGFGQARPPTHINTLITIRQHI